MSIGSAGFHENASSTRSIRWVISVFHLDPVFRRTKIPFNSFHAGAKANPNIGIDEGQMNFDKRSFGLALLWFAALAVATVVLYALVHH